MVRARLYLICGNCGSSDEFIYKIVEDYDDDKQCKYLRVSLACQNCITYHNIDDNAIRIEDK